MTIIGQRSITNGTTWGGGGRVDKVMTVREVAQFLRVHQTTVYRLLRTDSLPAFKVGSDWRFSQQAVEAWIKKNTDLSES